MIFNVLSIYLNYKYSYYNYLQRLNQKKNTMIRKLVLLITLLSMQGMFAVYAGNNIMQLNDVTAQAGENITLDLEVINDDQFVAFQLDIPLPEGFDYVQESIKIGRASCRERV